MKHVSHVKLLVCLTVAVQLFGSFRAKAADKLGRRSDHPYLTYSDANIARLKERIRNEPSIAEAWAKMLANANRMMEPSTGERGRRGGGGSNELLCLAYRMTGDKRFGECVKESLLAQKLGGRSGSMLMLRQPPWHSGLGSGEACASFGIAFDTVYDLLTSKERKTLATRLAQEGILPVLNDWVLGGQRIHSLDTMGHNWWSAIVFGAGIGAMAIMDEDPRTPGWVQRVGAADAEWLSYAGSLLENKPANFDSAGGFYESVSYAGFAIRSHLPFRLAWRDAFVTPLPEHPVLGKIADYFMHTCYPRSGGSHMSLDFGDSSITANGAGAIPLLWALGYRNPGSLWYLSQFRGGRGNRGGEASDSGLMRGSPRDLLYSPTDQELAAIGELPDLPRSKIFPDMGWIVMRSSWEKDATLLGIKSGYTWNHAHADTGSFVLFHQGKYLLIDSGKSGYSTPEYDDYYRQSIAHNVVTFNGKAENPEDTYFGSKFSGTVSQLIDAGDLRYVLADATGPTSNNFIRNFRSFLWIGDVILVIDDLKSFEPGQFEWLLHYDGEGKRDGLDYNIANGDARVIVRPLFPEPFPNAGLPTDYPECMRLEERIGLKDHDQNTKMPYVAFLPTELERRTKFITAIMPVQDGDWTPPKIERLRTVDMIGLRITQHGEVTELWLNLLADGRIRHRNANLIYNGWETDAYLTAFTWPQGAKMDNPDTASRVFVIDGSYLRRDSKVVLDSLSKVYLCATKNGDTLDVQLQGQPVINALLRTAKRPAEVNLNGQHVEPTYDKKAQNIWLSVRGK